MLPVPPGELALGRLWPHVTLDYGFGQWDTYRAEMAFPLRWAASRKCVHFSQNEDSGGAFRSCAPAARLGSLGVGAGETDSQTTLMAGTFVRHVRRPVRPITGAPPDLRGLGPRALGALSKQIPRLAALCSPRGTLPWSRGSQRPAALARGAGSCLGQALGPDSGLPAPCCWGPQPGAEPSPAPFVKQGNRPRGMGPCCVCQDRFLLPAVGPQPALPPLGLRVLTHGVLWGVS